MKRKQIISKGNKLRNQIKRKIKKDKTPEKESTVWIPSGALLFNLVCSDSYKGAYKAGTMVNIIGDSSSGKSILVLSGLAATANSKKFDNYDLIYDDAEFADSFDHHKLFGQKFVERIQSPKSGPSTTIEQFYDNVMDQTETGKPFVYALDSFDAIDADDEIKKELKNREHRKAGNLSKIKGSFQATKQKKASQFFRHICSKLKETKSVLIIISQTRDNLSAMGFQTKYRAGGKALKFYASIEAWLANAGAIKKGVKGVQHRIGVDSLAKVTKNKYTGKHKEAKFPIFYDYGIDDITASITYLLENKWWVKKKQTILAPELKMEATLPKLIQHIEKKNLEKKLFRAVQKCWKVIEAELELKRRSKYNR